MFFLLLQEELCRGDWVCLPPGHRDSDTRNWAQISADHISPGSSFSLGQMSSIPPLGSGDEFVDREDSLSTVSFFDLFVPWLVNLCMGAVPQPQKLHLLGQTVSCRGS